TIRTIISVSMTSYARTSCGWTRRSSPRPRRGKGRRQAPVMARHRQYKKGAETMLTRRNLLATAAAGVTASSLPSPAEATTPANILVIAKAIDGIVGAFDPAESYEAANNEACGNIYRKLILPDPNDANKLVGDLAESWKISPDGLVFSFEIRRGVK